MSLIPPKMIDLQAFPKEILNQIIEHLVVVIGIQKAVMLRTVSRSFNAAILEAICVSQVLDIYDPATPNLVNVMGPTLRGKIFAVKSLSPEATNKSHLSVIASVNRTLDSFVGETDEDTTKRRHESVAKAVGSVHTASANWWKADANFEAGPQNLLGGAIVIGNLTLVKELLESEELSSPTADVNGITQYFGRPLILAATCGRLEIVQYLLDSGARPDLFSSRYPPGTDTHGEDNDWDPEDQIGLWLKSTYMDNPLSALSAAVLGGYQDIVRLLLRPQYRLASTKVEWQFALLAGARAGRLDLIQEIFEVLGRNLSDYPGLENLMIWEAIQYDRKEVVQMLLDNGVDVNAYLGRRVYSGTLQTAARMGKTKMARFLIERGAGVNFDGLNSNGNLPIETAARCGQEEIVQLLLEHGADPTLALQSAAQHGQPRVMKLLLDKFPGLPQREDGDVGRETVWKAIASRSLTAMTLLVENGVSLNEGYPHPSMLPINMAKQGAGLWVVEHLISLGAEDTDEIATTDKYPVNVGGVLVSERTWEWVGKY